MSDEDIQDLIMAKSGQQLLLFFALWSQSPQNSLVSDFNKNKNLFF